MKIEKLPFKKSVLPQLVIITILLTLTPYAVSFKPSVASEFEVREWMIVIGLLLPLTSLILFISTLHRGLINSGSFDSLFSRGLQSYIVTASAVLAVFTIGWRCFPYWLNGVYQMDLEAATWIDMDPKRLPPMLWIGDIWRLGVLLLALATFVSVPILMAISIRLAFLKQRSQLIYTVIFCAIALAFHFILQKDYMAWLLD